MQYEKASEDYYKIIQWDPVNINALLGMGRIAMVRTDYDDAKEIYSRLLQIESDSPSMAARLGKLDVNTNMNEGKPFYDVPNVHAEAHRALSIVAYHQGDSAEVLKNLQYLDEIDPSGEHTTYGNVMRASAYLNSGLTSKALQYANKAITEKSEDPMAWFFRGSCYSILGWYSKASDDFRKYLDIAQSYYTGDNVHGPEHKKALAQQRVLVQQEIARLNRLQLLADNHLSSDLRAAHRPDPKIDAATGEILTNNNEQQPIKQMQKDPVTGEDLKEDEEEYEDVIPDEPYISTMDIDDPSLDYSSRSDAERESIIQSYQTALDDRFNTLRTMEHGPKFEAKKIEFALNEANKLLQEIKNKDTPKQVQDSTLNTIEEVLETTRKVFNIHKKR
eukprot:TRINITY_DN3777_c0_g1_i3.p1 TRINITY_DN3777_c0_g1~~TRINITY_DN3777_c0_g1_i3.p1  ORF type:complete len:390 (-),score=103.33 TRINITY_DN3777_c0_g1_i3:145-1314(-)